MKIINILITIILCSMMANALSVDESDFYNREDTQSLQMTVIGQQLSCADYPSDTRYVNNYDSSSPVSSYTFRCDNGLINWWEKLGTSSTWLFKGEMSNSRTFNGLSSVRSYKFECYPCPSGTTCKTSQVGTNLLVNSQEYALCTSSGKVNYWVSFGCSGDEIVNTNSWNCEQQCVPDWKYTDWTECQNNMRTRQIMDSNNCGTSNFEPPQQESCFEPSCYVDSDCSTGYKCDNGNCLAIPPPPSTCDDGEKVCNTNNNVAVCDNDEYAESESCNNGCEGGKCIEGANYSVIIILSIVVIIVLIIVVVIIVRKK